MQSLDCDGPLHKGWVPIPAQCCRRCAIHCSKANNNNNSSSSSSSHNNNAHNNNKTLGALSIMCDALIWAISIQSGPIVCQCSGRLQVFSVVPIDFRPFGPPYATWYLSNLIASLMFR